MKKFLPLIGVLIIGGALFFIYKNAPEKSNMENTAPDVTMEASALFSEFSDDEAAANEKYLNKVVIVSGAVAQTVSGENGKMPNLSLKTGDEFGSVICSFDDRSTFEKFEFHADENVKLKCVCMDYYRDVKLVDCVFVK